MKNFILIFSLFFSLASVAGTAIYQENGRLYARLDTNDSQRLYSALKVSSNSEVSPQVRNITTRDGAVEVNCTANLLGVGVPYGCVIAVNFLENFRDTVVYEEDGVMNASLHNEKDAQSFYESLLVRDSSGRSGSAKSFQTQDGKAKIFCTKNNLGVGNSFNCTVSISVK